MLGGGTFTSQNKTLPGAYVNTITAASVSGVASDRGVAAIGLSLDWGAEDTVIEITNSDFIKNSLALLGYDAADNSESIKGLRDIFKHSKTILVYRLNGGGTKASNTYGTARCSGTRGNDINITITTNVDDTTKFDVNTYFGTKCVDRQTVSTAAELTDNDYVVFIKEATLSVVDGEKMSGGSNGTELAHSSFLSKMERCSFNAIGVVSDDESINLLYSNFGKTMREDYGIKFNVVCFNTKVDFEGTINVKNTPYAVYWTLGVAAGIAVNKSATNMVYDGEFDISCDYTQSELEQAIENGEFAFHFVGNTTRVLADINSLVTTGESKGEIFKSNQTVRAADRIATDCATVFNEKYLGAVQNNADGRDALWSDIHNILTTLVSERAIEAFEDEDIVVEQGTAKNSVVISCAVTFIGAMEKLYLTCVIS